jgi:hypothetical protein
VDEEAARRIADRGRDALVARLRPTFAQTAASHAHLVLVPIGPQDLERMVQEAADRADGVLWRRALAAVAVEELGISLTEAIFHPAVLRAHELVEAPAYEPAQPVPAPQAEQTLPESHAEPVPAPQAEQTPPESHAEPVPVPARMEQEAEQLPPAPEAAIRVAAVHLSGIETLREGARNIELRFFDAGLDVVDTARGQTIGRLIWEDIKQLEVPTRRRSIRRGRNRSARLLVRTGRGEALFELPGLTDEQVHTDLAPIFTRTQAAEDPG